MAYVAFHKPTKIYCNEYIHFTHAALAPAVPTEHPNSRPGPVDGQNLPPGLVPEFTRRKRRRTNFLQLSPVRSLITPYVAEF